MVSRLAPSTGSEPQPAPPPLDIRGHVCRDLVQVVEVNVEQDELQQVEVRPQVGIHGIHPDLSHCSTQPCLQPILLLQEDAVVDGAQDKFREDKIKEERGDGVEEVLPVLGAEVDLGRGGRDEEKGEEESGHRTGGQGHPGGVAEC